MTWRAWTLAGVALVLSASGGAAAGAQGPCCRPSADTVVVQLTNALTYVPDTVRIMTGGTVRWKNTSLLVHTVTDDDVKATLPGSAGRPGGAKPFDSGNLEPGGDFVHTFPVPGVYHYFCVPHEAAGMQGVVIVGGRT